MKKNSPQTRLRNQILIRTNQTEFTFSHNQCIILRPSAHLNPIVDLHFELVTDKIALILNFHQN